MRRQIRRAGADMGNFMMNLMAWLLLLLVILMLYLIDKVNQLIRLQGLSSSPDARAAPLAWAEDPASDLLFAGLQGKKLWDAMSGLPVEGVDATRVDALRPHYEPILRQHIVETFKEGLHNAQGYSHRIPSSLRTLPTPRGHVTSWLPPQHLGCIYRTAMEFSGHDSRASDADTLTRLRHTLDHVADMLYQRAGLTNETPLSECLFNPVPQAQVCADETDSCCVTHS